MKAIKRMNNINNGRGVIIGESTPIRIGLVVAFLAIFGSSIWWAASINGKLDSILSFQNNTQITFAEIKTKGLEQDKEISDLKLQQALDEVALKTVQDRLPAINSR